jgi:ribosome-associated protein
MEARRVDPEAGPEGLARELAAIADSKQGREIVALDVRGLVGYTDFLVLCTARNERLAKAIADEARLRMKREGLVPARAEGERESRWILLDYLDAVLHVFVPETRDRYRLDQLWGEAPKLDLDLGADGAGAVTS